MMVVPQTQTATPFYPIFVFKENKEGMIQLGRERKKKDGTRKSRKKKDEEEKNIGKKEKEQK